MNVHHPLDPDLLSQLEGLTLRARRVVDGFLAGSHRSPRQGASIEFAQHREYTPGDDLRYLDWKAFGRTDRLYVKQFEDETNFSAMLIVDASGSMGYRGSSSPWSKWECAQTVAASLAWLLIRQGDAAGMALFGEQLGAWLPPAAMPGHLGPLVETLEQASPKERTDWPALWNELLERLMQRSVIAVVSDLLVDPETTLHGLATLRHAGHDVLVFHVHDPAEIDFPFRKLTRFRDLEGSRRVVTDPRTIRTAYRREFSAYLKTLRFGCQAAGIDYLHVLTDRPLGSVLAKFLAHRSRVQRWG